MRVWNAGHLAGDDPMRASFGVTYEGLKQPCSRVGDVSSAVLELPMRVWNKAFVVLISRIPGWFWSYLWGFETWLGWGAETFYRSFGVTYEGLKPGPYRGKSRFRLVLELPMRVWNAIAVWRWSAALLRFGVTYEGLKPILAIYFDTSLAGFGVTYEGLKPAFVPSFLSSFTVFWSYLWGFETRTLRPSTSFQPGFWSYLWGFETRRSHGRQAPGNWFWSYLWGFETGVDLPVTPAAVGFGVTYEGLKLRKALEPYLECTLVLELPMRVWNSLYSRWFAANE